MKHKIKGNRYDYIVVFSKGIFEILCRHRESKRKSTITNENTILGEIVLPILDPDDTDEVDIEDSFIEADDETGKKLFETAKEVLSDKSKYWINYLEKNLDEDMSQGGWNSGFSFR